MLITTLLILLATSCRGVRKRIACGQIRSAQTDSKVKCDISFRFNRCKCSCFNLTEYATVDDKECGDDFESGRFPLEACEGMMGFHINDWADEFRPKIKKLNSSFKNYCGD